MPYSTWKLGGNDWAALWPMLRGMGTDDDEPTARRRCLELLGDPRWAVFGVGLSGRLVGYAAAQDYGPHFRYGDAHRLARLHDVYVDPAARRRGAGRALMDAVTAWAAEHVRYLEWQAGRDTAAPFYERLGYRGEPCPQPDYPTFVIDFRHHPGR